MEPIRVGFAFCGSFCTYANAMVALERVKAAFGDVLPIVSEHGADMDTRFGNAHDFLLEMERICDKRVIRTIQAAEPIGPKGYFDVLVVAPCTGTTLGKLANGISDTPVTLAVKSHLRRSRPVVLAVSTNDALGASMRSIALLKNTKHLFFVPMGQDDVVAKPNSLVADFTRIGDTIACAMTGLQIQPLFFSS